MARRINTFIYLNLIDKGVQGGNGGCARMRIAPNKFLPKNITVGYGEDTAPLKDSI